MSLHLDKSTWKRVRLGDVIVRSRVQVDPVAASVERYVAGGHFDSGSPTIQRWGDVGDGQMGSTFRYAFRAGQVLLISARPYLRKVGIPQFEGVVADKTYVLDAVRENGLCQEFLPFLLLSDQFCEYAVAEATGSMNPRLLWGAMQRFEFDLPPLDEQERIADLLWAVENERQSVASVGDAVSSCVRACIEDAAREVPATRLRTWVTHIEAGRSPRAASEPATDAELGVLKVSAVGFDSFVPEENKRLLNEADFRPADAVKKGDLLVTRANAVVSNVARPCMVDADYPNLMLSDKTLRLVLKEGIPARVVLAVLRASAYRTHVREAVGGTEAKNISQERILAGPVPDWDAPTIAEVSGMLTSLDAVVDTTQEMSRALDRLRSSLMDDIFRGVA